jgi:hypothetical protein
MEQFLLKLGKGFAFVGRQYRISIDNEDYHADLIFYHIYLKRYVIIDLKRGKVRPQDIGQMNMLFRYIVGRIQHLPLAFYSQYIYVLFKNLIYQAIVSNKQLSNIFVSHFRNHSTGKGQLSNDFFLFE